MTGVKKFYNIGPWKGLPLTNTTAYWVHPKVMKKMWKNAPDFIKSELNCQYQRILHHLTEIASLNLNCFTLLVGKTRLSSSFYKDLSLESFDKTKDLINEGLTDGTTVVKVFIVWEREATSDFLGTFLGKVQDSDPIPATKFVQ